jgi:hypothetical protein
VPPSIIEKIAHHLVKVLRIDRHPQAVGHAHFDGQWPFGMDSAHHYDEIDHRWRDRGLRPRARTGSIGARPAEMMADTAVDLVGHVADLVVGACLGELQREGGEGRLQAVRQIGDVLARVGETRGVLVDQRIQFGDERLQFTGLVGGDMALGTGANGGERRAEIAQGT